MTLNQKAILIYSKNTVHYKGVVNIEYDNYDPRLSDFTLLEITSFKTEEDLFDELELIAQDPSLILKYCVPQKLGVIINEVINFKCRKNAVHLELPYKLYNLAQQNNYLDNVLNQFNFENKTFKQKIKTKTVYHEFSIERTFIENLLLFSNAVVNEISRTGTSRVQWTV